MGPQNGRTLLGSIDMVNHIVPEWYLLSIYRLIKRVPSQFLGIMLFLASMYIWRNAIQVAFNSVLTALGMLSTNNQYTTVTATLFTILGAMGAQLPLAMVIA